MPFPILGWLIATALVAATVIFWDDIRDRVAEWLRNQGLSKSSLMDAWIKLDLFMGKVRCLIFGQTRQHGVQKFSETTYEMDQIQDADVRAELKRRGEAQRNVMNQIN